MTHLRSELERRVRERVEERLERVRGEIERTTVQAAPLDEGALQRSITATTFAPNGPDRYGATIRADALHASYTDTGTGVYAGGGRIYPRNGRVLVFYWKNGPRGPGTYAFRSVAGIPAQRWFREPMPGRYQDAIRTEFG